MIKTHVTAPCVIILLIVTYKYTKNNPVCRFIRTYHDQSVCIAMYKIPSCSQCPACHTPVIFTHLSYSHTSVSYPAIISVCRFIRTYHDRSVRISAHTKGSRLAAASCMKKCGGRYRFLHWNIFRIR